MEDYSTIYKFRNFKNSDHRNLLIKNELFLANSRSFNDPFDCKIPLNLELLNTDSKRLAYAERIYRRDKNNITKSNTLQKIEIEKFGKFIKEKPEIFQDYLNKVTFQTQESILGIISFSLIWDNLLLWSHYGDNHNGLCVGLNRKKLENSFLFSCGSSVEYTVNFPDLDPLQADKKEFIQYQAFIKAKDWEYEKEYRLIKFFDSYKDMRPDNERKIYIPNEFFSEIILGCNFPANEENEIFEIAETKKILVYRATKQKNSFLLKKIKLYPES